jgi:peptidoglycan/xylan/chitin deacetylase (PgdA/CDA1 family)
MQQHNPTCNENILPYPETWDSVEASRYASNATDIWVPVSDFRIDLSRVNAIALESFYSPDQTQFYLLELVPSSQVPADVAPVVDLPGGDLVFNCRVENTFAFGIDDGDPALAQQVLQILKDEDVNVTFFVVGQGLASETNNLTFVYLDALNLGHQVGLHSYTHARYAPRSASDEAADTGFYSGWRLSQRMQTLTENSNKTLLSCSRDSA